MLGVQHREVDPSVDRLLTPDDVGRAPAPDQGPGASPWSWDQVVAGLVAAFEGSPYVVHHAAEDEVYVRADIVDRQWWTLLRRHQLTELYWTRVRAVGPRTVERQDASSKLSWSAGVDSTLTPSVRWSDSVSVGRSWRASARKDVTVTPGGLDVPVDYRFSSEEVQGPVRRVLEQAGWQQRLDPLSRVGAVFAIGSVGLVLVGGAVVLVLWLTGNLPEGTS